MSIDRRIRTLAALVSALAATTLGGPPALGVVATGYPASIAVLGHSGATGENSDPASPGAEVRANSWATGTDPAVDSVYLRILAKDPAIAGHAVNLAQAGATVSQLVQQAHEAVALSPAPELLVIQIMDNDIECPASTHDYVSFRATFASALGVLVRGAPASRIFVVSQFGSPDTFAESLSHADRRRFARESGFRNGPCDFIDPSGRIAAAKVARLNRVIHRYEAQLRAACRRVAQCRYDGDAFGGIIDERRYVSSDLNHFSIAGHAKAAAVAWAAMQRAGVVPQDGQ